LVNYRGRVSGHNKTEELHSNLATVITEGDEEMDNLPCSLYGKLHDLKALGGALLCSDLILRDDGSKLRIIHRAGSVYSEVVEILDSLTYKLIIADRVCGRLVEEGCGAACACELLHTSLV